MDIPAVVGARSASQLVRQDDWVIIDGDAGVMIVDPSPIILAEYGFKQRQGDLERGRLSRLRHTPAVTLDGQQVELLANIEMPEDALGAVKAGAVGVGLFRSEFLFMGREAQHLTRLPDEEEQYQAYRRAVEGMQGMPVTIRTIDVGADKPLDGKSVRDDCAPESGAGPARDPLEPGRPGDVPDPAARHPARRRARRDPPADPDAGARQRDPADPVADRLRARRTGQPRRRCTAT